MLALDEWNSFVDCRKRFVMEEGGDLERRERWV